MASFRVKEIAAALGAEAVGDTELAVTGAAEPGEAGPDQIALAMSPDYAGGLTEGSARAALLWPEADWQALGLKAAIFVPRARVAMVGLTQLLDPGIGQPPGIHSTAVIAKDARIGEGAAIGAYTVIGAGAEIGPNAQIGPQCFIGDGAVLGAEAILYAGVKIGPRVQIGDRFRAQFGAVVGADGFSFATAEKSRAEVARETMADAEGAETQPWLRIHSLGAVVLGDDVEIGANACIDGGTIRPTRLGAGCKLDNHVHIAHNVEVGRDCLFAAQVGIAGSVTIGDGTIFGGKVGVVDNIFVGKGVVAGGGTVIMSNVPDGRVMLGYPAVKIDQQVDMYKALRRLPRVLRDLMASKKAVPKSPRSD